MYVTVCMCHVCVCLCLCHMCAHVCSCHVVCVVLCHVMCLPRVRLHQERGEEAVSAVRQASGNQDVHLRVRCVCMCVCRFASWGGQMCMGGM